MMIGAPLGQRFEGIRLEDVHVHDGNRVAVELARRIVEGEALSLLLYGETARGKTTLLAAVLNEVNEKWPSGRYAYWPLGELAIARRGAIAMHEDDPIWGLLNATVAVIDDIGVEAPSDYAMEGLQTVVDRRWRDNRPLLLGSNLNPTDREFSKRYGPRILRRFVDRSAWLCELTGDSWAMRQAPRSPGDVAGPKWTDRLGGKNRAYETLERVRQERKEVQDEDPEARAAAMEAIARLRAKTERDPASK